MSSLDLFRHWIESVERRFRHRALIAGAAAVTCSALGATLLAVWLANRYAFSDASLLWARLGVFLAIALAVAFGLAIPLVRASRRGVAKIAERHDDGFKERVLTLVESPEGNPFHEIVAEETLRTAAHWPAARFVPGLALASLAAAAITFAGVLVWLAAAGPGAFGHGTALVWLGKPPAGEAFYRIEVAPGDTKVRKGSDQVVEARLIGFESSQVRLMVRLPGQSNWEAAPMEPKTGVPGTYGFLMASLMEDTEYRVEAGRLLSSVHRLTVVDLPAVEKLRVTYNFPSWLGLARHVEDPGGDLRAVEGTEAVIEVTTDRPLPSGQLVLDDGRTIELEKTGERTSIARIRIQREAVYHVAAIDGGQPVRISEDYFIEPRAEKPPEIRIARPGRDARVSPIEEVVVEVEASDDYGLTGLELRYSVNAGPEKAVAFPQARGTKEGKGKTLIALEDYKLQPGDLLSLYAVGRDARTSVQTDIYFLEAQPFEKEYRQAQQSGGGGGGEGGGEQQENITKRQKEIIAATWNVIRSKKNVAALREDSEFLTGVQKKLGEQARSLAGRMQSRELSGTNEEFKKFASEMQSAARAMDQASEQLKSLKWKEALQPEQKALQHLLRAESIFREIQVAFGQQGGGGGGGGGQSRDLESMFDLELDTNKNQYETGNTQQNAANRERQVDEALKKLEELARRQQQLAEQQRRNGQQSFQQRWEQEMLRREAEQLRRQMEELSRGQSGEQGQQQAQQGQQGQQGQQQGQGQSGQSGQSTARQQGQQGQQGQPGQAGQQRSLGEMARGGQPADPRMNRALQQLEQAIEDMRRAQQQGQPDARRAAERMADAEQSLSRMRRQQTGQSMDDLAGRARDLAGRQEELEKRIASTYAPRPDGQQARVPDEQSKTLAGEKDALKQDYERLERDMQSASRAMAGSQPQASSQVRGALGEAQQNELRLRLQYGADLIRRGLGAFQSPRERVVSQMMRQLSERMERARQAAAGERQGESENRESIETALNQIERARRALNRAGQQQGQQGQEGQGQQGQQGQRGQQGQSGQQGQQGQMGQQGQGGERGQGGQQGQREGQGQALGRSQPFGGGRMSPGFSAMNDGTNQGQWAGRQGGAPSGAEVERAYAEAMRQLEALEDGEAAGMEGTRAEVQALIEEMNRLDPKRFSGNPRLFEQLRQSILPRMEQLELRLRQQLGEGGSAVRGLAPSKVPPGYEKAAAEYYRKLSGQGQPARK